MYIRAWPKARQLLILGWVSTLRGGLRLAMPKKQLEIIPELPRLARDQMRVAVASRKDKPTLDDRDNHLRKLFCGDCGAHLFSRNPDDPTQMSVRLAAFDGDPGVRPSWRSYVAYAAVWEPIPDDGLERFDEGRPRA